MTKSQLIDILFSASEEDVVIMIDGEAYEISDEVEHVEESFDGFFTAFPAAIGLKAIIKD